MKTFLFSVLTVIAVSFSADADQGPFAPSQDFPSEVTIPFSKLRAVDEALTIHQVKSTAVVKGDWGQSVRILLAATSACGKEFFVNYLVPSEIAFYQLGFAGVGHPQPACTETLEYVWEPMDWELDEGQSSKQILKIKRNLHLAQGDSAPAYFVVEATVTKKSTPKATRYLVSDLKVSEQ